MTDPFGIVKKPPWLARFGDVQTGAIGVILQLIFNFLIVIGGIYALLNFIFAGYAFISAGSDPQKVGDAWKKIYQTIIGLLFIVGSFLLAAIIGQLMFGNASALLSPVIPTP
jgi:hypothetical protein